MRKRGEFRTNCFPLDEVEDGLRYTLNIKGDLPVDRYLDRQGRFKHLSEKDKQHFQRQVDADWQMLVKRVLKVDLLEQPAVMKEDKIT